MADYQYNYATGVSYPNKSRPYESSEGWLVPSDLPPRNQIYSTSLQNLTRQTTHNLELLKAKLIDADPCYAYGPQHWHPNRKWEEYEELSFDTLQNPQSKYDNHDVMFTTVDGIRRLGVSEDKNGKPIRTVKNKENAEPSGPVNAFCYLCTTVEEHQKHVAKRGLQLKAKKKPRVRIQFIAPPPLVKKKVEEEEEKLEVLYKVSVTTGPQPLAATSAKVSIILRGRNGPMKKRLLSKKGSVNFTFGRNTTENFFIKGPKIGQLRSLTIEHDGLEKKHSWYLEVIKVEVVTTGEVYWFPCKQWLSLYLGDNKLRRTLQAQIQEADADATEYEVTVVTADKFGAGTDANVFLTIYGKKGVSPKKPLRNKSKNNFEAGNEDKFLVTLEKNVGLLTKIRLEHDNSGVGPGWFVEKVVLQDTYTGKLWTFPCGQWLAKDEGDRTTFRDLFPIKRSQQGEVSSGKAGKRGGKKGSIHDGPTIGYEFTVVTGVRRHAGTDAHVFITMVGKLGRTREVPLDDGKDHFEKGQTDQFKRKAEDVGDIKRIVIRHDNAGLAAGWYLNKIVLRRYFSGYEVKERLATMATEMHEHVSNITGEEAPGTPTKRRGSLKHQRSVSFDKGGKKKGGGNKWEEEEEEDMRKTKKEGRRNPWDDEEEEEDRRGRRKEEKKKHKWDEEEEEERRKKKKKGGRRNPYDDEEEEDYRRKEKEERKRSRSRGQRNGKLGTISEEESEEDKKNKKGREKKKKKYQYQGIEVEATDSETETDSDYEKRKRQKKKEKKNREKQRKCYIESSSDDSDDGRKKRTQKGRRKYDDSDSEEEKKKQKKEKKRSKKKYESESEEEERVVRKRRGKKDSSSESSSETDEEVYTKWTKGRVPYCDEYVFEVNRWLATDEDDGQTQRELRPQTVTTFYKIDD